ncbi:hypothetical protein H8959_017208 [Pygathrix nigripes]
MLSGKSSVDRYLCYKNDFSALADAAMGKKVLHIPYRDSVLTKLLQSALERQMMTFPHLLNVNEDPQLTGVLKYFIQAAPGAAVPPSLSVDLMMGTSDNPSPSSPGSRRPTFSLCGFDDGDLR